MIINEMILESEYSKFVDFIQLNSGEKFEAFATSKYLNKEENYKYKVHEEARGNLDNKLWRPEQIGTGRIQKKVISAIKARVNYDFEMVDNNLINWRQKDGFSKKTSSKKLEKTLFDFYKSKIREKAAFEQFKSEKLSYQFIAYLFFIKDIQRFLPISQERFDKIFKQIGLPDFKTSGNSSWENYSEFCGIIKQVQKFLKTKDENAKLLDAHSFLWIIGNQMQSVKVLPSDINKETIIPILNENSIESSTLTEELKNEDAINVLEENILVPLLPEEICKADMFYEGSTKEIIVNAYERNSEARKQCLNYYGRKCVICSFDFSEKYGSVAELFIHVHHLRPLADIGEEYRVNPVYDLRPVCPNCHAVIHLGGKLRSIEEMKEIIKVAQG